MIELREHQKKALSELASAKILLGGVGSGKTLVGLSWANQWPEKDLYVITTAKKRNEGDWEREAALLGITGVVVDSWNNIGKYRDLRGCVVLFDEQRVVGSGAWTKHFLKICQNNDWLLLTATPGDTWLDYIPVFLANGFYKNRTEFKHEHVIYDAYSKFPKVKEYRSVGRLVRQRNAITVEMPFERHTTRHLTNVPVFYDKAQYADVMKRRWNVFEDRPCKNISELFFTLRRVVNSDSTRFSMVKSLLAKHDKLIVFYNFNYELEELRKLQEFVPIAEWNGQKHEEIPKSGRWVYLVQYIAGAEGWNCVETDAMVFYSLTYSYKQFEQAMGRIDRLNTKFVDLWYYLFKSDSAIDRAIWGSLSGKKSFNEASFVAKWGKITP